MLESNGNYRTEHCWLRPVWMIETFFRMFKQLLGCRHLLSTKPYGVEIQVYCGIIACLLIMLYTGRKPTKRTFEMVCFYLSGWASADTQPAG